MLAEVVISKLLKLTEVKNDERWMLLKWYTSYC